ncbi:hypothetical protein PybrP1_002883 [[Pythium] brassicae (nom. inval.)]|nr:hypothetical protein PybrP1_002883 [[Pythium] brassicae (nom. inval.)]
MDINAALMRRAKLSMPKRKRAPASGAIRKETPEISVPDEGVPNATRSSPFKRPKATVLHSPAASLSTPLKSSPVKAMPTMQSYIDVGQRSFGKHTTCPKCELLYTLGVPEDEKEHERFCKSSQRGLTIASWKNERLVRAFPEENARIIEIRREDSPARVKKLLEVKLLLDDALGFVDEEQFLQRSSFLFVQGKQIVGCVTVDRVDHAFALDPDASGLLLWVHPSFRGKKIATRLVNSARDKLIYGMQIATHQVAFAQPTKDGLAFARSYVAPGEVLVYDNEMAPRTFAFRWLLLLLLHAVNATFFGASALFNHWLKGTNLDSNLQFFKIGMESKWYTTIELAQALIALPHAIMIAKMLAA